MEFCWIHWVNTLSSSKHDQVCFTTASAMFGANSCCTFVLFGWGKKMIVMDSLWLHGLLWPWCPKKAVELNHLLCLIVTGPGNILYYTFALWVLFARKPVSSWLRDSKQLNVVQCFQMVSEILVNSGSGYGLVQMMPCCRTPPGHYQNQCWPRSMLPYDMLVGGDNIFCISYFNLKEALICMYIVKQTHLLYVYDIHWW